MSTAARRARELENALIVAFCVVAMARLPLLGAALGGIETSQFEEPLAELGRVEHAGYSPLLFYVGLSIFIVLFGSLLVPIARGPIARVPDELGPAGVGRARRVFPAWGWLGIGVCGVSWLVAWGPWFESSSRHTFVPLWAGYIAIVNGLAVRATGECLLFHRSFVPMTAASAVFWWFFEYLNRFVESWTYHGLVVSGPVDVFLHAVLPFATVLPAVASTQDLLACSGRLNRAFVLVPRSLGERELRLESATAPSSSARLTGVALVVASCLGLLVLSWWPDLLFPLLWLSPLFVVTGARMAAGRTHLFSAAVRGDFRLIASAALAGVICGFFWELWNFGSVAKWTYSIPYVDAVRIFEMPLLGYAGYLTFGWECAVVADMLGFDGLRRFSRGKT